MRRAPLILEILFIFLLAHFTSTAQDTSTEKHNKISSVQLSPDEMYVSFESGNNIVKVYEVASGKLQCTLEDASSPEFSPDGKYIATISSSKDIKLWEVQSGKLVHELKIETSGKANYVEFSPSGKYVFARTLPSSFVQALNSLSGPVQTTHTVIWETATGNVLQARDQALYSFSADESRIVYVYSTPHGFYYDVSVCDAATGEALSSFESHDYVPQVSKDRKYILSFQHKQSELWEIASGRMIYTFDAKFCSFTKDGKYISLESETSPGTFKYWEIATLKMQDVTDCAVLSSYSPNKNFFVESESPKNPFNHKGFKLKLMETDSCKLLQTITEEPFLGYCPDGKFFLTEVSNGKSVNLRDLTSGEVIYGLGTEKGVISGPRFSASGKYIISFDPFKHPSISIWETANGKLLYSYPGTNGGFTKDEKFSIFASDSDVKICEAASGNLLYTLQ